MKHTVHHQVYNTLLACIMCNVHSTEYIVGTIPNMYHSAMLYGILYTAVFSVYCIIQCTQCIQYTIQ